MQRAESFQHIAESCGHDDCGCPEMFVDHNAPPERRIVIVDDYGQRIQMSAARFRGIVEAAKNGALDYLQEPLSA